MSVASLVLLLVLASPIVGLGGVMAARSTRPRALGVAAAGALWALLGGVALLVAAARFWRLHRAGQALEHTVDTFSMARDLSIWGVTSITVSLLGAALLYRRRKRLEPS